MRIHRGNLFLPKQKGFIRRVMITRSGSLYTTFNTTICYSTLIYLSIFILKNLFMFIFWLLANKRAVSYQLEPFDMILCQSHCIFFRKTSLMKRIVNW